MGTGRGDKTETLASEPAAEMNWPERVEPKAPTVSWREGTKARPGPQCARKGPETDEVKRTDDAAERMQPRGKRVWEVPRSWPRPRRPASFGLWSRAEPRAPAAAQSPARVRPVPFALLKEQGPHLGPGSRRWCKTALGETDRQTDRTDDEGGPPHTPSPDPGGQTPSRRGGSARPRPRPGPKATHWRRRRASVAGSGEDPEALYLPSCSTPGAPPRECAKSRSLSGAADWEAEPEGRTCSLRGCTPPAGRRLYRRHPGLATPSP